MMQEKDLEANLGQEKNLRSEDPQSKAEEVKEEEPSFVIGWAFKKEPYKNMSKKSAVTLRTCAFLGGVVTFPFELLGKWVGVMCEGGSEWDPNDPWKNPNYL